MNLQELHIQTGINQRRLRYCLDPQLIPGISITSAVDEVGRPRKFHGDIGVGIACAAKLQELVLPYDWIRRFLVWLPSIPIVRRGRRFPALETIVEQRLGARAELGDGMNVRLVIDSPHHWASLWRDPSNPAELATSYRPTTTISLDLGLIVRIVYGH